MTFAGLDIGELSQLPLDRSWPSVLQPAAEGRFDAAPRDGATLSRAAARRTPRAAWPPAARRTRRAPDVRRTPNLSEEKRIAAQRIAHDVLERIDHAAGPGPGLPVAGPQHADAVARRAAAPAAGHADPLATCSAWSTCSTSPRPGLHPADGEALLRRARPAEGVGQLALRGRARPGHDAPRRLAGRRRARRRRARRAACSTAARPAGLRDVAASHTRALPVRASARRAPRTPRTPTRLAASCDGVTRNNLHGLDAALPAGRASPRSPACRARASRAW